MVCVTMPKKRRKIKKKLIIVLACIAALVAGVMIYFERNINPVIVAASSSRVESLANKALAETIAGITADNTSYADLVTTVYDSQGDIKMIQSNSAKMNAIAQKISLITYDKIENIGKNGIDIAIGTLTGMPVFTEKGPFTNFEFLPIGSVRCEIKSEFSSAGINQTIHRIFATVNADITVIIPGFRNRNIPVSSTVLFAESIIVGKVPNVYLQGGAGHSTLNLVP